MCYFTKAASMPLFATVFSQNSRQRPRGEEMTKRLKIVTLCVLAWLALASGIEGAGAVPLLPRSESPAPLVLDAKIFQRGRPPIYPYYYYPGRPGGYSFYFGFVPYRKGDYESQALQREYPESNWPRSMRGWTPKSGF
jgi:hypothetical protein